MSIIYLTQLTVKIVPCITESVHRKVRGYHTVAAMNIFLIIYLIKLFYCLFLWSSLESKTILVSFECSTTPIIESTYCVYTPLPHPSVNLFLFFA